MKKSDIKVAALDTVKAHLSITDLEFLDLVRKQHPHITDISEVAAVARTAKKLAAKIAARLDAKADKMANKAILDGAEVPEDEVVEEGVPA